ncbi:hypothetical protein GCM10010211_82100 [Streptomyces albospinus]|uniref:Kinase n=1 Tax=Streptomyces albospinus TaxID=285515 RepID=A0ABQ2VNI1_9ACTN|nr:hypothetical protein GCM10010211_82100 [Streptomyces albospinus]
MWDPWTLLRVMSLAVGSVTAVMVGTEEARLVVLRGNSASGKSSVAAGLRGRFGRGLALVGQDNLRRVVLRERDRPGAANIGLIDLTARYALDAGYHVVVEGTLYADRYGEMLAQLRADHRGPTHGYCLDVPFEETLARHAAKPQAGECGKREMRDWYRPRDLLSGGVETVVGADSALSPGVGRTTTRCAQLCGALTVSAGPQNDEHDPGASAGLAGRAGGPSPHRPDRAVLHGLGCPSR